ncbi:DUF6879 family protein [Actinocorallia populi]|uniref:DUF6879 family protein n=1 Tax=Actinocorallia populi TaxID=2079200 RepID=UPI000D096157|nr:DUF6879 family protein [Actinocorallia populi]
MELQDLAALIQGAKRSAWRLETLPVYTVPQEEEEFAAWRAGRAPKLQTPETSAWLAELRDTTARGFSWGRVHVVDLPLTPYTRYELWGYQANAAAGEDIGIAERDAHPDLELLRRDFWLVDDATAVWMDYDADGRFLQPVLATGGEVEVCRRMRDIALAHAEPLEAYLTRKRPRINAA